MRLDDDAFGFKGLGKLIRAGSPVPALDAAKRLDDILDLAPEDKPGDPLRIAGASADERAGRDDPIRYLVGNGA